MQRLVARTYQPLSILSIARTYKKKQSEVDLYRPLAAAQPRLALLLSRMSGRRLKLPCLANVPSISSDLANASAEGATLLRFACGILKVDAIT